MGKSGKGEGFRVGKGGKGLWWGKRGGCRERAKGGEWLEVGIGNGWGKGLKVTSGKKGKG